MRICRVDDINVPPLERSCRWGYIYRLRGRPGGMNVFGVSIRTAICSQCEEDLEDAEELHGQKVTSPPTTWQVLIIESTYSVAMVDLGGMEPTSKFAVR
jgi:hypothetical protein